MAIALSCGLVLLNEDAEILLAHATETRHWTSPRAHPNPANPTARPRCARPARKPALVLAPHTLIELGRFALRRGKDVHLFATRLRRADISLDALTCTSMFASYHSGRLIPEMDAYRWASADDVPHYASQSLARLFAVALPLAEIHARLQAAGR